MRVKPLPVEVPSGDPFHHDLLERKSFGEALAASLAMVEGPCVFALDGKWGTGKSTFVRMFTQHLRNQNFGVVEINAWETDYADDPLGAITSSMMGAFPDEAKKTELKNAAVNVLKAVGPPVIRMATYGLLDASATLEKGTADMIGSWTHKSLERFQDQTKSLEEFSTMLRRLAEGHDKPIVVVVDELDRCRPNYAVGFLETIKHVFEVDGLLFVLAVNREQLDHAAAVLYGRMVDPESYFRRFFDVELRLPYPADRREVVNTILTRFDLPTDVSAVRPLVEFLAASPFGIREQKQVLQHYAMVRASLGQRRSSALAWEWLLPTFLVLRLIDGAAFQAYLDGTMTDQELLLDHVFRFDWTRALHGSEASNGLEAATIVAHKALHNTSPLSDKYTSEVESDDSHAREVVNRCLHLGSYGGSLRQSVRLVAERIEWFDLL